MKSAKPENVDAYIAAFEPEVRAVLEKIRATIHKAAPDATETISYQMPAFTLHGVLVYFAAFRDHIGFYPTPSGVAAFQKELKGYASAKGSVRFPLDQPIPFTLIGRIAKFRASENVTRAAARKKAARK